MTAYPEDANRQLAFAGGAVLDKTVLTTLLLAAIRDIGGPALAPLRVPFGTARALVLVIGFLPTMVRKETFRKLRESAGMTQAEMAELLRVPLVTLTKWETDSLDMKAKALLGLLTARRKK